MEIRLSLIVKFRKIFLVMSCTNEVMMMQYNQAASYVGSFK